MYSIWCFYYNKPIYWCYDHFICCQNHGLMVPACHTRTGADRISGLSTGWYTMGQAVGWWSFIISDGIFFYGWLKFIEGCKSKSVDICFFSKHECPQKKTVKRKDLVHSHYYQNSETLANALKQSPNNFESSINGISRPVNSDCIKFSMMIRDIENTSDQLFSKLQIVWRCFLRVYTRMMCIFYIHTPVQYFLILSIWSKILPTLSSEAVKWRTHAPCHEAPRHGRRQWPLCKLDRSSGPVPIAVIAILWGSYMHLPTYFSQWQQFPTLPQIPGTLGCKSQANQTYWFHLLASELHHDFW